HPFIGGSSNKKVFFIDNSNYGLYVDTFNSELNEWETNNSYRGLPNVNLFLTDLKQPWIANETTGISFLSRT
ncbi:1004_t:CDS:1, partial [Dentiscutata erythropus]